MAELIINGEPAIAEEGARLLDFLHTRGIEVPTMCYDAQLGHFSSCMICAVKDVSTGRMVPACAVHVSDGMQIETDSQEIRAFRRTCLELLLSEHLGDCEGPCRIGCPAHMNIPAMIRQIKAGDLAAAIVTVKAHIALPAILGRICSAPCEKVCRRGQA
ncbi:2Fe-2S iron-sulfur cluster-binding protein, partial [Planctomycetota bacterium]